MHTTAGIWSTLPGLINGWEECFIIIFIVNSHSE